VVSVAECAEQGGQPGRQGQRCVGELEERIVLCGLEVLVGEGGDLGEGEPEQQDQRAAGPYRQRQGGVGQAAAPLVGALVGVEEDVRVGCGWPWYVQRLGEASAGGPGDVRGEQCLAAAGDGGQVAVEVGLAGPLEPDLLLVQPGQPVQGGADLPAGVAGGVDGDGGCGPLAG